jgi:hypothetical protein
MPDEKVKAQDYIIEISLSDTFTIENFYKFTVRILPKFNEQEMKKDKNKVGLQGKFKL